MKKFLLMSLLALPCIGRGASTWDVSITFVNQGAKPWGVTCPEYYIMNKYQYGCGGEVEGGSWGAAVGVGAYVTNSLTLTLVNVQADVYTCDGSSAKLTLTLSDGVEYVIATTSDYTSQHMPASYTFYVNGDTCGITTNPPPRPPGPRLYFPAFKVAAIQDFEKVNGLSDGLPGTPSYMTFSANMTAAFYSPAYGFSNSLDGTTRCLSPGYNISGITNALPGVGVCITSRLRSRMDYEE